VWVLYTVVGLWLLAKVIGEREDPYKVEKEHKEEESKE
jgi:hypothetical protein